MSAPATDWPAVVAILSRPYGAAYFRCADGILVHAQVWQHKMALRVGVLLDGRYLSDWHRCAASAADLPTLPARFCRTIKRRVYRQAINVKTRKAIKSCGLDPDACTYQLAYDWGSAAGFIGHLRKHNPGIAILDWASYERALAERVSPTAADPTHCAA